MRKLFLTLATVGTLAAPALAQTPAAEKLDAAALANGSTSARLLYNFNSTWSD